MTRAAIYQVGLPDGLHYEDYALQGLPLTLRSAFSGQALLSYEYDARQLLSAITDAHGNTARYERDAQGRITRVIGMQGQQTRLAYNAQGLLAKVVQPGGREHHMRYDARGLLIEYRDPRGHADRFEYDARGKLTRNRASDGFGWDLAQAGDAIEAATALGHKKTVQQATENDALKKTVTGFDGLPTLHEVRTTWGLSTVTEPDQTRLSQQRTAHPVFGGMAPSHARQRSHPDGLSLHQSQHQSLDWNGQRYTFWRQTSSDGEAATVSEFTHTGAPAITTTHSAGPWQRTFYAPDMQPLQTETSADMQLSHEYNARGQRTATRASAPGLPTRTTAYAWRPHGSKAGLNTTAQAAWRATPCPMAAPSPTSATPAATSPCCAPLRAWNTPSPGAKPACPPAMPPRKAGAPSGRMTPSASSPPSPAPAGSKCAWATTAPRAFPPSALTAAPGSAATTPWASSPPSSSKAAPPMPAICIWTTPRD